jgi:heme exporter protein D
MTYWSSWSDFIAMGGYGLYVWGSFGAAALLVAAELWQISARRRELLLRAPPIHHMHTGHPNES